MCGLDKMEKVCLELSMKNRDDEIEFLFRSGHTLQAVGDRFGISRERVRQILSARGLGRQDGGRFVQKRAQQARKLKEKDRECLNKHGCTYAQYRNLLALGRHMMDSGERRARTPTGAFILQRRNANDREIAWNLTLWEWWTIWKESGKWEERGRGSGYVMCRYGDAGAYEIGNVFIAPARLNNSLRKGKKSGLPIGVHAYGNKFSSLAMVVGKQNYLGSYDSPEEAAAAYREFLIENGVALAIHT